MTWTPLVDATFFDGIKADVLTTNLGIMTIALIILGGGILLKVMLK
ncbi:MAG: hypothetical protein ACD_74C00099G0008 [uncultured bacterium]|nr:MAG: hypothetical protein ACD_74C00099G0008 [uncultured bacterium]